MERRPGLGTSETVRLFTVTHTFSLDVGHFVGVWFAGRHMLRVQDSMSFKVCVVLYMYLERNLPTVLVLRCISHA